MFCIYVFFFFMQIRVFFITIRNEKCLYSLKNASLVCSRKMYSRSAPPTVSYGRELKSHSKTVIWGFDMIVKQHYDINSLKRGHLKLFGYLHLNIFSVFFCTERQRKKCCFLPNNLASLSILTPHCVCVYIAKLILNSQFFLIVGNGVRLHSSASRRPPGLLCLRSLLLQPPTVQHRCDTQRVKRLASLCSAYCY